MKHISLPEIGHIVEITRGRDAGLYAVVIGHVPDRYVLLADGDVRKADTPKKKNVLHVKLTPHQIDAAKTKAKDGKYTNAQLRHALKAVADVQKQKRNEEGGSANGER
ncbi:KOW domain-containing RNA-binding protein [Alicyclobacillus sp. SO9]|uniref:KOW domain-containing RNA-binding protein n=1 Tax=Alicyclobacillus sp. SO9 TaxID=2665646 RepID=UPI001E5C4EC3|nr:KOW domain-containing RNA-binding protein [Alicyclobacillus sp. SO9]